jgi:hypothetical protein
MPFVSLQRLCREYAAAHGWILVAEHVDPALSGASMLTRSGLIKRVVIPGGDGPLQPIGNPEKMLTAAGAEKVARKHGTFAGHLTEVARRYARRSGYSPARLRSAAT